MNNIFYLIIALVFGAAVFCYGAIAYGSGLLLSMGSYGFQYQLDEETGKIVGLVLMSVGIIFDGLVIKDVIKK